LEQLIEDLELTVRLTTKYNPSCPNALVQLVKGQQAIANESQITSSLSCKQGTFPVGEKL
jgi:hypothetical protein